LTALCSWESVCSTIGLLVGMTSAVLALLAWRNAASAARAVRATRLESVAEGIWGDAREMQGAVARGEWTVAREAAQRLHGRASFAIGYGAGMDVSAAKLLNDVIVMCEDVAADARLAETAGAGRNLGRRLADNSGQVVRRCAEAAGRLRSLAERAGGMRR
jgi:hypothetical protein